MAIEKQSSTFRQTDPINGLHPLIKVSPVLSSWVARSTAHKKKNSLSLTHSLTHSLTQSLTHSVTQSLSHSVTQSLSHSVTHSLTHSLSLSLSLTHCSKAVYCTLGIHRRTETNPASVRNCVNSRHLKSFSEGLIPGCNAQHPSAN